MMQQLQNNQLKVWTKDAAGNDNLSSFASHGVSAISLNAIATPFDIKTSSNQLLGSVQSSSVTLNENGSVGSVQHIDLTICFQMISQDVCTRIEATHYCHR
jgi:hypothetical protein